MVRDGDQAPRGRQPGEGPDPQRRLLLGPALQGARNPGRPVRPGDRRVPDRRLDGEPPGAVPGQSPHPPARGLRGTRPARVPADSPRGAPDAREPRPEARDRTPGVGRASARSGDRSPDGPGPPHGHERHHGLAPVRGDGLRSRQGAHRGHVRGPPGLSVRRPQHGGSPVPPDRLAALRRLLLEAGQRHLPSGPSRDLRGARAHPSRHGQPHAALRRARDAGDRRGRPRRRLRHGREPLLLPAAPRRPGGADGPAPALGRRQGRHPRAAPATHRPRGLRQDLRVRGSGRGDPDGAPARDDREHGRRARPDHVDLPLGRGHPELPRAPRARRDLAAARRRRRCPLRRHARDRPLDDRASRRASRIPGPRRPRRRGRGNVDRAGPGRLVHERLVGGHVRRRRGPARPARSRGRLVRPLPGQPAGPRDDGAPGSRGGPHRGGRGHLRVDVRRVPRHRPRPGHRLSELAGLQPELPRAEAESRATRSTSRPPRRRARPPCAA